MALLPIVKYPDPRLKERSQEVTVFDDALRSFVSDMGDTMYAAPGVGLAAVQVGVLKRILVLDANSGDPESKLEVFINPEIVESSGEQVYEEGCLSLPEFSEEVKRKEFLRVRFQDVTGASQETEMEGFRAVILQHELDHLNGVLATDRISRLKRTLYQRKRNRQLKDSEQEATHV
jgi:peptide deformylase